MASESVYVKVEYAEKVRKLARIMKKPESEVRQLALELGLDCLLELSHL